MSGIFSKIISGEIPAFKVAENDLFLAFLDVNPVVFGHILVIPKTPVDYIFDIEDKSYTELMLFAKQVAIALKKIVPCKKIGVSVIGLEVPHAHVHLIPMNAVSDMNFSNPRCQFSKEEFEKLASQIALEFKS